MIIYGIYDSDDCCCCVGTAKECSRFLKCSLNTFYCRISRNVYTRIGKYQVKKLYKEGKEDRGI